MVKFNKKKLLDDISKILVTLDGEAYDKKWGKHIATSHEPVQYFLVARELKRQYPKKYKNIFIDNLKKVPKVLKSEGHGVKTNDNSSIYKKIQKISTKESELLKRIDMLIEYKNFWLLIQFKLLRPMGGRARTFDRSFFKPILFYDKFDSSLDYKQKSSIPYDILKFNEIKSKSVDGKKIKKLVIAIYYPSDNLWPNEKLENFKKKHPTDFDDKKVKKLEILLKTCENKLDVNYYTEMLDDIYGHLEYAESREIEIKPMNAEIESIKPSSKPSELNFSEFFHTKVKLLSWEIPKSVEE